MKKVFNETHIGQPVHSEFGNGVISHFMQENQYSVVVMLEDGRHISYTQDGRRLSGLKPSLRFGHIDWDNFDYGKPKFIYKPFKFTGEPTWCWVLDDLEKSTIKYIKRQVIAYDETRKASYWAVNDGNDNMHCKRITPWVYAMALTDEELNDEE